MNIKRIFFVCALIAAALFLVRTVWQRQSAPVVHKKPFSTMKPTKTTIRHTVHATGFLRILDNVRVGSLVGGLVKEIFVEEDDQVKKGQLLATIDNGKKDTAIRAGEGNLLQAQATYDYTAALYEREKSLFEQRLRSPQEFQSTTQQLQIAQGALASAQAALDVAKLEYDNTQICSPEDGIIISIGVKKGLRVTTDLDASVLFEIAKDVSKMEAELSLEESAAGHVKKGQKITFTVDNHPHKKFKSVVRSVSYAPVKKSSGLVYRAMLDVDNSEGLLRPGMTINATIKVAKKKDALSVENISLYLDTETITAAAKSLNYTVRAVASAEKKELEREGRNIKYVWVVNGNEFVEQAIETGLYNDRVIEALSGLGEEREYLFDVYQPNEMEEHYKKIFKGAL